MSSIKPPGPLDFASASECWGDWRRRFERYRSASGLADQAQQRQVDSLIYIMGEEAEKIMVQITPRAAGADEEAADTLFIRTLEGFDAYFSPRDNSLHYSIVFSSRVQGPDESNEEFIRDLYELVAKCGWSADQQALMLRTRILAGMKDKALSRELQLNDNVTINDIKVKMRAKEIILKNQKAELDGEVVVAAVKHRLAHSAEARGQTSRNLVDCRFCGLTHASGRCPAYGKRCNQCRQFNHFARMCRSGKAPKGKAALRIVSREGQNNDRDSGDEYYVHGINADGNAWFITGLVNSKPIKCQIDTGAQVSVIGLQVLRYIGINKIETTRTVLSGYGGHRLNVVGKVTLPIKIPQSAKTAQTTFYVVEGKQEADTLIGMPAIRALAIIPEVPIKTVIINPLVDKYSDVFQGLGKMKKEIDFQLKENAVPRAMPPRSPPQGIRSKLKEELDRLVKEDIICRDDEPSEWLSPPVIVRKPNGKIRLCLDPQYLNSQLVRSQCSINTPTEIFSRLSGSTVFSCLDGKQGFHQIPLSRKASRLTCFITPFGKYRYLRCPMGICNAPEIFHSLMLEMVEGIEGVEVYIDDILVHAPTKELHDEHLRQVLERCRAAGVTLNLEKSVFAQKQVTFLGHQLSAEGIRPEKGKVQAVLEMSVPEDKKAVERFLGFINYLGKFIPNLSELCHPLRLLCRKEVEFVWEKSQEEAFQAIKSKVCNAPTLGLFNANKPVCLSADASAHSIGAVILQEGRPIEFAAKSLTECQQRYSQIEKEMLAVVFACQRFKYYCYGSDQLVVETDHKPLLGLMKKDIAMLSPRLASMRLMLLSYSIALKYTPGKYMVLADTLSRSCPAGTDLHDDLGSDPLLQVCNIAIRSSDTLKKYQEATLRDEELSVVIRLVQEGWPSFKKACPSRGLPFWRLRNSLTVAQGLLFYVDRLVVPVSLRREVLDQLHVAHQGVTKTLQRAQQAVFWPGLRRRVEDRCLSCEPCRSVEKRGKKEPLLPSEIPRFPFEKVGIDLFQLSGETYVMLVDYFSKWPVVKSLSVTSSKAVIQCIREVFADFGIPEVIVSDNGPQFSCREFAAFCSTQRIEHITSSPLHPSGNGQVERAIGTVKEMMKKALQEGREWHTGLMAIRNTPVDNRLPSPSQLLQGRVLRDQLPLPTCKYQIQAYNHLDVREALGARQSVQKYHSDRHAGPEKPMLPAGQAVYIRTAKGSWIPGKVLSLVGERSYLVETSGGMQLRRNRIDLRESSVIVPDVREQRALPVPGPAPTAPAGVSLPVSPAPGQRIASPRRTDAGPRLQLPATPTHGATGIDVGAPQATSRAGRPLKLPGHLKDYVM